MKLNLSAKVDAEKVRKLRKISRQSRIPQAKLLGEAIDLLEAQFSTDVVTPEFRRSVDRSIQRNLPLLKKLAE